ncbi:hypothetical protein EXIGLDRAFT_746984 [Exidia glandulosa HHB12029]|uniref:Uncharacterized protein n=1 Tax=Exidia glandulosa HHB12029 TaxID=1314781 RepID=A0A165LDA2_EXIGL|nr:hypothetical protein EXIGLDRAFT_746984 [Exidia glandulosa HHB12029]
MDESLPLHPHDETRLVLSTPSPGLPALPFDPQALPPLSTEIQNQTPLDPATKSHSALGSQIPSYSTTSTMGASSHSTVTPTSQSLTTTLLRFGLDSFGAEYSPSNSAVDYGENGDTGKRGSGVLRAQSSRRALNLLSGSSSTTVGAAVSATIIAVMAIIATTVFVHRRRRRRRLEAEESAEIKAFPSTDGDGDIMSPSERPALGPTTWTVTAKRAPEPSAPPPSDIVTALQEENALLRAVVAQIQSGQDGETLPSYESRSVGSESDTSHTATIRSVE